MTLQIARHNDCDALMQEKQYRNRLMIYSRPYSRPVVKENNFTIDHAFEMAGL